MAHSQQTEPTDDVILSPIVAAVLSAILPGLGHYLAGDDSRAVGWFAGTLMHYLLALGETSRSDPVASGTETFPS
jgi:hypothetical protein